MKNKHLRTLVAIAALLTTVFLAGCSGSKTETAETQVTLNPVAEAAGTQTVSESILPVAEAAELNGVPYDSKLRNTFSNQRVSVVGQATSFPTSNDITYFIKDNATGATFMYIITRGGYGNVLATCVTQMTN